MMSSSYSHFAAYASKRVGGAVGYKIRITLTTVACLALLTACDGAPSSGRCNTTWSVAFDGAPFGWFLSTWGATATERWATGGPPSEGVMLQYDSETWNEVSLPGPPPLLNWMHGFETGEVIVVGNGGYVARFDGQAWVQEPTPTTESLWGIWGPRPTALWAVGGTARETDVATVLFNDGNGWTNVTLPTIQRANVHAYFKVWGTSDSNVYVVGQRGVVLHFDGSTWTELFVGASSDLISLWGTDEDNIVAVGGRANGIVSVWDGVTWETTPLAPLPGLNGVWMRNPNVAHVAGAAGTVGVLALDTMEVQVATVPGAFFDFHAIFGTPDGTLTAVGGNLVEPMPPFVGLGIERCLDEGE